MPLSVNDLTPAERRARVTALGAVTRGKNQRYDDALNWFVEALRLDPGLDLAATPDFWYLPHGGLDAAVQAYEAVGRAHQASVLAAMIRRNFRPRLIRS